ncbi:MAG: D-2-hydroxyacid dehydrogenase [Kiritimatiellia bacterium]|jgi:glycerate dehydrogenase
MKIVILDAYACNPGDLDWNRLAAMGELAAYDRTPPDQVIPRCAEAEIVFTNKTHLGRRELTALPKLRFLGLLSTGTNAIDVQAATELGIPVSNIPAYGTPSVAQSVFALLLDLTNQTARHSQAVHDGVWTRCRDFCFTLSPIIELSGLTLGLVGFGAIGQAVARIGRAFGMDILVHTRAVPTEGMGGILFVDLPELLSRSDVVSLHCPLNDKTKELINRESIAQMKSGAMLINTGRGGLVNEADLAEALNSGRLGGAGLDVLGTEPPKADNPLLTAARCVITPHVAWASKAARARLIDIASDNLRAFLDGAPINLVV